MKSNPMPEPVRKEQSRPERRREAMRRRIIEEASQIYRELGAEDGGLESTTVEMICERSDISVRTFFRYFDSKLDVIFLDYRRAIEDLITDIEPHFGSDRPEIALLRGSLDHFTDFTADPVNRERIIRSFKSRHFAERRALWRMRANEALTHLVITHLEDNADRRRRAGVIVSTIRGIFDDVILTWVEDPEQDFRAMVREAFADLPAVALAITS